MTAREFFLNGMALEQARTYDDEMMRALVEHVEAQWAASEKVVTP